MSAAEQTAGHLRKEIREGRWADRLPGVHALASECEVSPATMRTALRILEGEGWIRNGGTGRARTAVVPDKPEETLALRITILPGLPLAQEDGAFQKVVMLLQYELEAAGHVCRIAPVSQEELSHDVKRVTRFMSRNPSDAWVVIGARSEVVAWMAETEQPVICLGGGVSGKRIASTAMFQLDGFNQAVRQLVSLGHQRILFLWPHYHLDFTANPYLAALGRALADVGREMTSYHVPKWKPTPRNLRDTLEKTFRFTPPTAIITTYGKWMAGVLSFLAQRGLRAPQDISLFSINEDDWFEWIEPEISCLRGDDTQMVRRIVRWSQALARGKADHNLISFPLRWVKGGTIGPPPRA